MGEAFLTRKGGASFRSLYAVRNPDKMEYNKGQYPDLTGAIIGAQFGTIGVPLHESAWTYLNSRLMPDDPNIHITAQIGRYTKTLDIPVTVNPTSAVLNDNDWETISEISAAGLAKDFWNIGDIKYFEWQGNQIAAKIIGFDHNDLDASDPGYNNPDYNGGSNKAGITFQWFTINGKRAMNNAMEDRYWGTCDLKNITMPAYYNDCPQDLQSVIRQVWIYSMDRQYQTHQTPEKLFLLNFEEYNCVRPLSPGYYDERMTDLEHQYTTAYEYYENGGALPCFGNYDMTEWVRSVFGIQGSVYTFGYVAIEPSSESLNHSARYYRNQTYGTPIYPAFCV